MDRAGVGEPWAPRVPGGPSSGFYSFSCMRAGGWESAEGMHGRGLLIEYDIKYDIKYDITYDINYDVKYDVKYDKKIMI